MKLIVVIVYILLLGNICSRVEGATQYVDDRVYPLPRGYEYGTYSQDCLYFDSGTIQFDFGDDWTQLEKKHINAFFLNVLAMFPASEPATFKPIAGKNVTIDIAKTPAHKNVTKNRDHKYYDSIPMGDNEHYEIRATDGSLRVSASSVFGVYHAFKTLLSVSVIAHAPMNDRTLFSSFCVPHLPLRLVDSPRYGYRGLLLDTGRAFYQVSTIKAIIDAMCLLKMNVLHWHITDDQSFPIEMPQPYRDSFEKAVYHVGFLHNKLKTPPGYYSKAVFKNIDRYAISRGIRIIPEVDMPSHARSWGMAYQNLTVKCPEYLKSKYNSLNGDYTYNVPLDISIPFTYKIITNILTHIKESFSDPYIHLGGDEVSKECWYEDKAMLKRMAAKEEGLYSNPETFTSYFFKQLKKIIIKTVPDKTVMLWEDIIPMVTDALVHDVSQGDKLVFQLWKGTDTLAFLSNQPKKRFIYSYQNYLDPSYQQCKSFIDCYNQTSLDTNAMLASSNPQMLGIEACAWELVPQSDTVYSLEMNGDAKERSFKDRVWHRLIAIAEKTWSHPYPLTNDKPNIKSIVKRAKVISSILDHALKNHMIDNQPLINLKTTNYRVDNYNKEFN
ncbi:hypothetical protein CYY_008527 [Polysphondylium violaceum]|uniref:Beta-hexosaminidase n=1 Tax=Polysphondylium violaceum TaxID=133409 RepID=A0A8J4UWV9_9MYCE|nr:hypothetical protein CYY_008527 [Polysphondylium violaceum]